MKIVILTWFLLLVGPFAFATWDLNDVSYLMPLPASVSEDQLLGLESPGLGGALLEPQVLSRIPILAMDRTRAEISNTLRVIAVRVDPCFPLPTPQACQRQVRMVWQPIETGRRGFIQTVDAALHSFYVLEEKEFFLLLADLKAWKSQYQVETRFEALQVHPAWAQEGDRSPALLAFHKILKTYVGQKNMTRVTAMVLRGNADMWAFVGLEKKDGEFKNMVVPRLQRFNQTFINMAVPQDHFSGGGISPQPQGSDTLNNLAGDSLLLETGSEDLIRKEVGAAFRIQNPHNFSPENMDCVSCHVAQVASRWVINKRPDIHAEKIWSSEIYSNAKYDLSNHSPEVWNTHSIRAFGYFGANMAISQRVINESAEVADALNQIFP